MYVDYRETGERVPKQPAHRRPLIKGQALPYLLMAPNLAWMFAFLAGALIFLGITSFRGYGPQGIMETWELTHYREFLEDPFYLRIMWRSVYLSLITVGCCVVIGFPLAVLLSRLKGLPRSLLYICIILPLLTSTVVRTFGWTVLLANNGIVNQALQAMGLTDRPVALMYNDLGVIIALTEVLLPLMVLALDAALLNIDKTLYDAARNLGASGARIFFKVTLPLAMPGVISGSVLVFSLAISAYVTPTLIGGRRNPVMSTLIYQQGVMQLNWPFGAAISYILLFVVLALAVLLFTIAGRRA